MKGEINNKRKGVRRRRRGEVEGVKPKQTVGYDVRQLEEGRNLTGKKIFERKWGEGKTK